MNAVNGMQTRFAAVAEDLRRLGASDGALMWIRRELPGIARCLAKPVPEHDVSDLMMRALKATTVLNDIAIKSKSVERYGIAVTRIDTSEYAAVPADDLYLPERPDFATLAALLHSMVLAGVGQPGDFEQKRGRRDIAGAVQRLMYAIRRPEDAASKAFADAVAPVAEASTTNPFADVASLVFDAATGEHVWAKHRPSLKRAAEAWRSRFGEHDPTGGAVGQAAYVLARAIDPDSLPDLTVGQDRTPGS